MSLWFRCCAIWSARNPERSFQVVERYVIGRQFDGLFPCIWSFCMSTVLPVVSHDGMQLRSSRIFWSCCASLSCRLVRRLSQYPWTWSGPRDFQFAIFLDLFLMSSLVIIFVLFGLERRSIPSVSTQLHCGSSVFPICCSRIYVFPVCLGFLLLPGYCGLGICAVCWTFYLSCIVLYWQCTSEICEIWLQGRNEARWRPGQQTNLAPPCSILSSFGSKFTVFKEVLVTLLVLFGARELCPLPLLVTPLHGCQTLLCIFYCWFQISLPIILLHCHFLI